MRQDLEALRPAFEHSVAAPDLAALQQQAEAIAAQVVGSVPRQPLEWLPHDGQGLDERLLAAVPQWQALGLQWVAWAEAPLYTHQFGAPTVAGLWTTPSGDVLLVHVAVRALENIDLETEFTDGLQLVTSLGRGLNFMDGGARVDTLHLDLDTPPAEMLALHRARVALAGREVRPVRDVADFEGLQERQRLAKLAYRRSEGLSEFEALGVPVEPQEHFAPLLRAAVQRRMAALG
jgi:hypothetical protein